MILKYSWVFGKTKSIEYSLEIIKGKLYFSYRMLMDFIKTQEKLIHSHDFLRHGKETLNLFHNIVKKIIFTFMFDFDFYFIWLISVTISVSQFFYFKLAQLFPTNIFRLLPQGGFM